MALDRQKILSELGSVVNQLQSADCGCMGKLFTNPGQPDQHMQTPMASYGGCGRGCCHGHGCGTSHSYCGPCSTPSAGEPYSQMNGNMNRPCVAFCNPPKLYADTYNYLNQNLMQPVVKEVYDDLKSITPANTVMNNPMANLMGLSNQGEQKQNDIGAFQHNNQMPNQIGMNQQATNVTNPAKPNMGQMGGMGPNIVNMIMGSSGLKPNMLGQTQGYGETIPTAMDASKSPYEQISDMPGQGQYNQNMMKAGDGLQVQNPITQYTTQSQFGASNQQLMAGNNAQIPQSQHMKVGNVPQSNPNSIPSHQTAHPQQVGKQNTHYGAHTAGVTKFNDMFPGVMQGLGGDLGFDPMSIAIQMNPANQQKVAMDNMHKLMEGNNFNRALDNSLMRPPLAATSNGGQIAQPINNQAQLQPNTNNQMLSDQQVVPSNEVTPVQQQQNGVIQQNQVYTTYNTDSTVNQSQLLNQQSTVDMTDQDKTAQFKQQIHPQQQLIKEPIFPADTSPSLQRPAYSNQRPYEYNTLGQPVEMLPAKLFQHPVSNLPQTLSPQDTPAKLYPGQVAYSNVKPTVSKTAIVGNRPVGKTPSRSQLHHIYNQYKGSQSLTNQNINQAAQGLSHSVGKLNISDKNYNQNQVAPVERVGGDGSSINQMMPNQTMNKVEEVIGQIGDVPAAKPGGDGGVPEPVTNSNNPKCRNGLQDMVFTSYPTSAAWSFHGNSPVPYYSGHGFRRRA